MNADDGLRFAQLWQLGHENYGKVPSDALTELAFDILSKHEFVDIKNAMMTHIATSPYVPKPADSSRTIDSR